eukprot:TRINITY_DN6033_c0_g1_i1.p1 TRINITY_DN6033_c0_g1~~TRINITY_DN6033_c0_g1_i1.p1  ORF type:complete len:326 (-),score=43.60 TRINITY_DN6033_c0_g1_i1:251-1183(-)
MFKIIFWVLCSALSNSFAKVLFASVFPHGDFALAPELIDFKNGSKELNLACIQLGKTISDLKPDLIFLSTPHGLAGSDDFLLYSNTNASGFAAIGQDLHNSSFLPRNVPLSFPLSVDPTNTLLSLLRNKGHKVNGLMAWADTEPIGLRWGEIIPLYFMNKTLSTYGGSSTAIVLSQTRRRNTQSVQMIPELLALGKELYSFLDALPQRVVVVISCDLAHTHRDDGPYGYSPAAVPFDRACVKWASTLKQEFLIGEAASYVNDALSCGYTGLVMLHGMLASSGKQWKTSNVTYAPPTYYGMMVASFSPVSL